MQKKKTVMAIHIEAKQRNWVNAKVILFCEPSEDQHWFSGNACLSVTHAPERKTLIIYCHSRADAWCTTLLTLHWWCSMTTCTCDCLFCLFCLVECLWGNKDPDLNLEEGMKKQGN